MPINNIDNKEYAQLINKHAINCSAVSPFLNRIFLKANNTINTRLICNNRNYTVDQLNMRRKAEILKHNRHASKLQSNITKKEKWSQLTKHNGKHFKSYGRQGYNSTAANFNNLETNTNNNNNIKIINVAKNCSNVQTLTSSSDVPGKKIFLFEDKNVPLTMYKNNNNKNFTTVHETHSSGNVYFNVVDHNDNLIAKHSNIPNNSIVKNLIINTSQCDNNS